MQTLQVAVLAVAATTALLLGGAHAFVPAVPTAKHVASAASSVARTATFGPPQQAQQPRLTPLAAGGGDGDVSFKIQVTGNNIEVTPAMREYVEKKLGKVLAKMPLHDAINRLDVHLSVVLLASGAKHVHTAEATLFMKGGQVLRASEETDYMYASIDLVSHRITRLLRKFKDRKLGKRKEVNFEEDGEAEMEAMNAVLLESGAGGGFDDPTKQVDMKVVKRKEFDMPAMSTADAIVCLDYIGHDFYVYRNDKSGEINVVYKRKQGGVGVIEPRK